MQSRFVTAIPRASYQPRRRIINPSRAAMCSSTTDGAAAPSQSAGAPEKKKVKILMIHGFTQNGPLFHAKTRAIEKSLTKLLAPAALVPQLIYPTAPIRLRLRDMPLYEPAAPISGGGGGGGLNDNDNDEPDTRAWWRRNDASGRYVGIGRGMATIAAAIRDAGDDGGIDGVVGFSQGGAVASLVAAALESERRVTSNPDTCTFTTTTTTTTNNDTDDTETWVATLRNANSGNPLKFAVIYSGFKAQDPALAWLLDPPIATPTLHVLGSLDTIVDEARSRTLVEACLDHQVVTHPGGHHVPVAKQWVMPLAGFIRHHMQDKQDKPLL